MTVTREEIADALSTVPGVTGSALRPAVLGPGAAWPTIPSHERSDGFFVTNWSIFIVLSSDEVSATVWFDEHIDDIRTALHAVVLVDKDEPALIPTDGGDLFALLISARSE